MESSALILQLKLLEDDFLSLDVLAVALQDGVIAFHRANEDASLAALGQHLLRRKDILMQNPVGVRVLIDRTIVVAPMTLRVTFVHVHEVLQDVIHLLRRSLLIVSAILLGTLGLIA